jgi:mono/diheme cytochrome c family protein
MTVALLALGLFTAACRQDMHDQPKYNALQPIEPIGSISDGRSSRPIIENTVARGQLKEDAHLYGGRLAPGQQAAAQQPATPPGAPGAATQPADQGGASGAGYEGLATTFPFQISESDITRGRDRYDIFCSTCHGRLGDGNGMIALRGFRKPPTFHDQRLRNAPVGHFFKVMTEGFGAMYDYSAQIEPEDRWRIIAYIRALQLSQNVPASAVPADRLNQLARPGQAQGGQH